VFGAIAILVIALGTPAVFFQYHNIGLPLPFITREEIIRAGILPSLAIVGIVVGLAYLVIGNPNKQQLVDQSDRQSAALGAAMGALLSPLLLASSLVAAYVMRKFHVEYPITLAASWHPGWKVRLISFVSVIPFTLTGVLCWRTLRKVLERVETASKYRWLNLGVAAVSAVLFFLFWYARRFVIPATASEPAVDGAALALFLGLFFILSHLVADLRSMSDGADRMTVIRQLVFVIILAYLSAVSFYSVRWYPLIPHYWGGGKPVPVVVWVAKAALADPLLLGCHAPNPDFARCDHLYLVSLDADYYIFALDSTPTSRGVILPRQAVGLISGKSSEK
jgi:hypothetical protein